VAPLISCVVPVYNGERFVAEAIESILAQTYRPLEVIVADDGSTDGTASILAGYGQRIRTVTQTTAGPPATRNLGLMAANGEFAAFLDADDLWSPEKLARQMERFQLRPELQICVTHAQVIWAEDMRHEAEQYRDHPRAGPVPGYATTTLLARRSVFDAVGVFDTSLWFSDATDWFLRARELGVESEVLPEVLVFHRMHEQNLTRRRSAASREEFARTVRASLDRRRARPGVRPLVYPVIR
jgi:glycosyltransferase involved in cell wall biosynthesis